MNDLLKSLVASMEEGEVVDVVAGDSPTETAAVVEVIEAGAQVEQAQDAAEAVATTTESLEAFDLMISARLASGKGYGLEEMRLFQVGVATTMNHIGAQANFLPSMEDAEIAATEAEAGDEQALIQVSQEADEGIKATLVKMWEAVKRAVARVWEVITTFFAKMFNSLSGLKKRAHALQKVKFSGKAKVKLSDVLSAKSTVGQVVTDGVRVVRALGTTAVDAAKLEVEKARAAAKGEDKENMEANPDVATVEAFVKEKGEAKEVELSESDVHAIGKAASDAVGVLEGSKKISEAIKKNQDEALKAAKAAIDGTHSSAVAKIADGLGARLAIRSAKKNVAGPYTKACKHLFGLAYQAVQVGQKAASVGGKNKEAAAA